jgi:hypothetical protein
MGGFPAARSDTAISHHRFADTNRTFPTSLKDFVLKTLYFYPQTGDG